MRAWHKAQRGPGTAREERGGEDPQVSGPALAASEKVMGAQG